MLLDSGYHGIGGGYEPEFNRILFKNELENYKKNCTNKNALQNIEKILNVLSNAIGENKMWTVLEKFRLFQEIVSMDLSQMYEDSLDSGSISIIGQHLKSLADDLKGMGVNVSWDANEAQQAIKQRDNKRWEESNLKVGKNETLAAPAESKKIISASTFGKIMASISVITGDNLTTVSSVKEPVEFEGFSLEEESSQTKKENKNSEKQEEETQEENKEENCCVM